MLPEFVLSSTLYFSLNFEHQKTPFKKNKIPILWQTYLTIILKSVEANEIAIILLITVNQ